MTLRIRSWVKYQGPTIKKVLRSRRARNMDESLPYAMSSVTMTTSWDTHSAQFAALANTKQPEAYLHRVMAYAALHSSLHGLLDTPPEMFGPVVLSNRFECVSVARGKRMYAALVESGICEPVNPQEAEPVTLPVTEPDALPETPCGVVGGGGVLTPPPPSQGGDDADASPENNGQPSNRERVRFDRVAAYVVACGANDEERGAAREARKMLSAGNLPSGEFRRLQCAWSWVTKARLTNFEKGAR